MDPTARDSQRAGSMDRSRSRHHHRRVDVWRLQLRRRDVSIIYSDVGKFCSIASHARLNRRQSAEWTG